MKVKKLIIGVAIVLSMANTKAQTPYYYYYNGEKQYLTLDTKHAFLSLKEQQLPDSIRQSNSIRATAFRADNSDKKQYQAKQGINRFYTRLDFDEQLSDEQYLNLLADMKRQNSGAIISPYFKIGDSDKIGLSNFFYVKLKDIEETDLLRRIAEETQTIIFEQISYMYGA